jgi:hypothetical protein
MRRLNVRLAAGLVLVVLAFGSSQLWAADTPSWTQPVSTSLTLIGPASTVLGHPIATPNLNCAIQPYVTNGHLARGCLQITEVGMYDLDHGTLFFGNTGRALRLLPNHPGQLVLPWPNSTRFLALNPVVTGGMTVGYYRAAAGEVSDVTSLTGELTGKQFNRPPDGWLSDASGQPLIINPGSLSFSDDGYWLVAETMTNNFVRINSATLQATDFGAVLDGANGTTHGQDLIAVSADGRFVAVANDIWQSFRVYDLANCLSGPPTKSGWLSCAWHEYWPAISSLSGFQRLVSVRFVNEGLLAIDVGLPSGVSTYELSPDGAPVSLTDYLGLGDSYTSGEGAFDYEPGTDRAGNMCHLSIHSYPLLLTRDLFTTSSGHSVACSGAVINDILFTAQEGDSPLGRAQTLANYLPGYLPQSAFVSASQPAILTVSIGGNDIGFGDLIRTCAGGANNCYSSYEDRLELTRLIDRTVPRWVNLYLQLQQLAPAARVYAIGYPQIADPDGNCADNVRLSHAELELTEELINYLNASVAAAAHSAGVNYIDISQALVGHRLCEATSAAVAMNGVTAGGDAAILGLKVLGNESYHPNALGQALIEQAILQQTHNFTAHGVPAEGASSEQLLTAPVSGRTVYTLVPDQQLASLSSHGLQLHANGLRDGLKPGGSYEVTLNGAIITSVTASSSGDVTASLTLPDLTSGTQRLDIIGINIADESVDVTQSFTLIPPGSDSPGATISQSPQQVLQTGGHPSAQVLGEQITPTHSTPAADRVQPVASAVLPVLSWRHEALLVAGIGGIGQVALWLGRRVQEGIIKRVRFLYNESMLFARLLRGFFRYLFVLILFGSLLALAAAGAIDHNLTKPKTVEGWLAQSGLYDHFLDNVIQNSQDSIGSDDHSGSLSLSDAAVQQAAKSAFPSSFIQSSVNTVIDSNYAWLQGKTATPDFRVDLTQAKQGFAAQVGQYVATYFGTLPVCTAAQLQSLQNVDPLHAPCRPSNISPSDEGALVTQQLSSSDDLLSASVITPTTINQNDSKEGNSQPYYQDFSNLPKIYRAAQRLPWALTAVAVLSSLAVTFLARTRRRGLHIIAGVLLVSGVLVIIGKLIVDILMRHLQNHLFNSTGVGPLQQSLEAFVHHAVNALTQTQLYFAVAYLLIGGLILLLTRNHHLRIPAVLTNMQATPAPAAEVPDQSSAPTQDTTEATEKPAQAAKPQRKRPTRLVQ